MRRGDKRAEAIGREERRTAGGERSIKKGEVIKKRWNKSDISYQ